MAKKGNRVQVILECTEHKESGQPGTSRYITTKNKKTFKIDMLNDKPVKPLEYLFDNYKKNEFLSKLDFRKS